ncbi:metallophosphoesterase family protein [Salipiger mangrovisoli]|uniref:Metallophosphoesterase n=1 Tax=Salipiger mangrovisoli TaxID=2865933 RepID=A0ABR9XAY5_9RHOB|nr:metallophosphoesterase [Salipiger mangrovisoli]MBE9640668.1 metallophosphoesterase [Salipiger mangrovisoli]
MPGPTIIEIPDNAGTVAVIADLHLKSYFSQGSNPLQLHGLEDRLFKESVDALIVAGDLSDTFGPPLEDALAYLTRYAPADRIYVVPGNHDYYAGRLDDENRLRDLVHASGSSFAQKTELRHRSDRYLCATLWTDFDLLGDQEAAKNFARRFMRDFDMIFIEAPGHEWLDPDEVLPRHIVPITAEDTVTLHQEHRGWLEERLAAPHFAGNGRTFVVTHHGPHPSAAGPLDRLSPAFHSNLTEVLQRSDIDTWFFGHSHRRLSSIVAGTRIQNVSIGYPDEDHGDEEDDLAEVCIIAAAPDKQSSNEHRDLSTDRQALEQDFEYALRCRETYAPVLVDKLSPETRASLRQALSGCACPIVPEGDAYYATDVIVVLGRTLATSPPRASSQGARDKGLRCCANLVRLQRRTPVQAV